MVGMVVVVVVHDWWWWWWWWWDGGGMVVGGALGWKFIGFRIRWESAETFCIAPFLMFFLKF